MNLGIFEILAIAIIAVLFFGPSRLPAIGKSVGEAIRGFKKGMDGLEEESTKPVTKGSTTEMKADSSTEPKKGGHES